MYGRTLVINETQGAPRGILGNHYRPVAEAVGMDELAKRGTPKKPPSRPITADFGGLPHQNRPAIAGVHVVSVAFLRDLAHLEVALRNASDAAIVANTAAGLPHRTIDPYRLFPVRSRAARDNTRIDAHARRASRSNAPCVRRVPQRRPAG
jgi:hypothetical protein